MAILRIILDRATGKKINQSILDIPTREVSLTNCFKDDIEKLLDAYYANEESESNVLPSMPSL